MLEDQPNFDDAMAARRARERKLAQANADKTPIVGGVDEPGLKPLRSGEATQTLVIVGAGPAIGTPVTKPFASQWIKRTNPHIFRSLHN